MRDLTHALLLEHLHYDPESGVFTWLTRSRMDKDRIGKVAGRLRKDGYLDIKLFERRYLAHRLAWLYVHGCWPANQLDHRDLQKANNVFSNLREATQSLNMANVPAPITNTSGIKGVSWYKLRGQWVARIKVNQRLLYLGYFDDINDAADAYQAAARKHFGEFARAA